MLCFSLLILYVYVLVDENSSWSRPIYKQSPMELKQKLEMKFGKQYKHPKQMQLSVASDLQLPISFTLDVRIHLQRNHHQYGKLMNVRAAISEGGYKVLWRGMSMTITACIPAHALYFSIYESIKLRYGGSDNKHILSFVFTRLFLLQMYSQQVSFILTACKCLCNWRSTRFHGA